MNYVSHLVIVDLTGIMIDERQTARECCGFDWKGAVDLRRTALTKFNDVTSLLWFSQVPRGEPATAGVRAASIEVAVKVCAGVHFPVVTVFTKHMLLSDWLSAVAWDVS